MKYYAIIPRALYNIRSGDIIFGSDWAVSAIDPVPDLRLYATMDQAIETAEHALRSAFGEEARITVKHKTIAIKDDSDHSALIAVRRKIDNDTETIGYVHIVCADTDKVA